MQTASPETSSAENQSSVPETSLRTTPRSSIGNTSSTPAANQRQPDSTLQSSIATRIDMTRSTPGYATLSWCGLKPAPPGCL